MSLGGVEAASHRCCRIESVCGIQKQELLLHLLTDQSVDVETV